MSIGSLILMVTVTGCSNSTKGINANSTSSGGMNLNGNANAGSHQANPQGGAVEFKEPERYSLSMSISAQAVVDAPSSMTTQQFTFAKLGSDRRWAFAVPAPLGHVVYLEKSGLKYLVFLDRNQYVEVAPDALGFQPGSVLTPVAIAEQLKTGSQYEQLGLEPVNGRTAMKYRITAAADAPKKTNGMIFVDQETSLPLRYELTEVASGTNLRVVVEARDVQLNPDRQQFDVPAGTKKITPQEAKPQVDAFGRSLRLFSDIMNGKPTVATAPSAVEPLKNKNAPARKNANSFAPNRK